MRPGAAAGAAWTRDGAAASESGPNAASFRASRRVGMKGGNSVNYQSPTSNSQGIPNDQLQGPTPTSNPDAQDWKLEVGSALEVGSWKLGVLLRSSTSAPAARCAGRPPST